MREKVERNKELIQYHKRYPDLSYTELGWCFHITKQRVHQILHKKPHKGFWGALKQFFDGMMEGMK